MKIQYWGTAAAEGVPALFCDCDVCRSAKKFGGRRVRTRSQLLINGELLIDFGPDTFTNALKYGFDTASLTDVLITHSHADHFCPIDIAYRRRGFASVLRHDTLTVHGTEHLLEEFRSRCEAGAEENIGDVVAFNALRPFEPTRIMSYTVTALPARHGTDEPFNYIIKDGEGKTFLLLNDTGRPLPETYDYLKNNAIRIDCVSFDCTFGNVNTLEKYGKLVGHMGLPDNYAVFGFLSLCGCIHADTKCIVTHFSHNGIDVDYEDMCRVAQDYGFTVSYDGMEIEF